MDFRSCFKLKVSWDRFPPNHDLSGSSSEVPPIIVTIDGLDTEASRQEEQLQFAGKKDMQVEFGEVTLVISRFKELLVRPEKML